MMYLCYKLELDNESVCYVTYFIVKERVYSPYTKL